MNGGNAFTFHETLLGLSAAPEVSISGNTVTGTGYLVYDDAVANGKAFTSDNLKLTYATDNVVAKTVNTTQGVKGSTEYALSGTVATTLHSVDFAAFVKALTDAGYTFDGSTHALAQNGKLTVKWSPVSGCYDTREGQHECTVGNVAATANTPKRVNSGLTQFQLFEGESHAVNVKNVAFVYEPAAFTVCENSGWKGTFTAEQAPAGQIYLMNTGNVTFEGCSFDKVVLTSFNCTGTSTVTNCLFKNVYNSYAVKDIRGKKVAVTGCTFENCGAAVMVSSTVKVEEVTISGNTFKDVDVVGTAHESKVGTRGLVQIASSGDYAGTAFDFSDNKATDCGPVLRQLNETVSFDADDKTNLGKLVSDGGASTFYTDDTFVAQVGDTKYATLAEAIKAVQDGETIVVNAGEYKLNGNLTYTGKAFTIQAAEGAKVSFDMSAAVALHGAKITFAGVTFDYKTNGDYIGLQHTDTLVYNDCTVNGKVFLYAASETFNRCTFVQEVEDYNVWTYGAKSVTFNGCTFKNVGKTINAYIEGNNALSEPQKIEMADCTVESSKSNKAVVNIKNKTQAYDITLTGKNEVSGIAVNETTKSAWYQVETTDSTDQSCKAVSVTEVKDDGTKDVVYVVKPYVAAFVTVTGIAGFADRKFASFAEAYAEIKPAIQKLGLVQESATADVFDALFTSVDANGNATLTYTISGTVVYDETGCANLLTMGRKASHYGNGRHLINFKFVGATGKDTDTLTVNSNITLPYEWWGEKTTTGIHFENLTITGSAPSGLYPSQPFFEGIDFSVSKCALKGIKIYNCSNVEGSYTITDSVLDGTGAPADSYAIHLQGNETAPLSINIKGNTISGYDRGINIDQKTAVATIEKNTISVKDAGRSCIQLSSLATADIVGNTLELTGGNAITLHENLLTLSAAPEVSISGNKVTGTGYLIYDDAKANDKEFTSGNLKLTYAMDNTVAETVDTTKGVKGSTAYITSTAVNNEVQHYVAQVGTTGYATLAEAFAALSAENHTLTLLKDAAWDAATPVYWAAGTQSGYAKTLTEALTAAYKANAGAITIVCRPGADVGTMTHGHVADDLTIYGNDAFISGGECDLEVDQYKYSRATGAQAADGAYLEKDITITAYELDNLGVWGDRHTAHMVTVNLTDCDGKAPEGNVQRVYISGTTGVNDITLTGCDFLTKATAVYSNADGAIKAVSCSFTDGQVPFNINHKANGTQTVAVENCTFTRCGDADGWKQFAAPLRLVNSGTGTQSAEVTGCAFAGTVGANGDILLGDGRTGQASNDVELKVVDTAANIQAQKPGYYNGETVDETKKATATSPAEGTLETSVAKLLPVDPRTLGYATSGKAEALPATPDMSGEVVNVTAAQAQYVLDGAYGPIDGKTINFTESINDTLILGRASKYDGSKTVYRHGSHAGEALSYADFIAYKNQSVWTESCYYERTVENVTFTANEGVTVKNFEADGGAHIYAGTAPVYDYVRDTGSWITEGSCYFKRAILKNITFKGLTFKAKTDINTSESTTVYDGFTFKDCTFDLGTTADGNQAIRYYNENNNGNVKNLVVEGCTFKTCSQGVYTMQVKGITVKDSTFTQTGHNAIAIQSQGGDKGPCNHGKVVITGNTFKNIGDRIIRFNNVGLGTTVKITGNTADGNSGKLDEATGKREIVKATTLPVNAADSITASGNDWGENTIVEGVFIDDYATKLGTEACPYSREQFAAMTRAEYREAQKRLGGTLYVNVGDYAYGTDGVLGNGVRDDTTGQVPDHSKLNAYGENGYLGEKNDGANGHAVVFVGGTITSGVTGYTSIDSIGTSLLLAVPAYTKVTFKGTAFKNVLSFDYQLYTSPWSQLGGLTFKDCTFDGIIVGAIAAQELAFNGCTFNDYVNTTSANNSNPTWIRPAYGNWTKGDNEGQGTDFRSLTKITFENNTVTSTRPVKFERIAQWEMATTVTATNNTFAITPQEGDKDEKKTKNVGLYFGANAKFDLVIDKNEKRGETAALYTAVYSAPNNGTYAGLPAGSTVKNAAGEAVSTGDGDALAWKTTDKITLKTTTAVASVTNAKGVSVNFATLADAIAAADAGATVTLLADVESVSVTTVVAGKDIVLDLNGKTLTSTANNGITIEATAKLTVKDSLTGGKVVATGKYSNAIENKGTLVIESGSFEAVYGAIRALGGSTTTISGGTFASSTGRFGMYYWANGTALSVTVNGGLFKNSVSTAMENGKVALSIKGGSFASDLTDYCGADAGTYLDKETGLYVYGRESEHVPAGYVVDENGNVTISDEESLFWFAQQVNVRGNTFTGKTVSLADDIALTAKWTPVGVSVEKSFKGTFDGKDHAITGMKVSGASQAYGYGFFKLVISATVKNVTFTQAEVRSEYSNVVGCVAGYSYGSSTFENVHVTDSLVYAFGKVGGFVGMAEDAGATTTFRNCSVEATTIHGGYNVAGFCGLVMGTCAFSGSSLTDVTPVVDEDSQGFGKVVELDTTVVCDGSVATCAGTGTSIKGRYIPNNGYYWSAYSDLYNHYGDSKHDCTLADGKMLANSEVVHDAPVAIGDARYSDLQAAFDAAKTGDTVTLLSDITLTEQVNITKALDGLTLDGNGKTIICATTDDPLKSGGGSALYFGNANDHLYCTGIKIKDLTMTGTARFAIFLCGGTTTEFTNVKISGNYYIAVNLYGTHGATMTNCDISNSTKGTDKYISAIWSNVASANPLTLNNSKVDVIAINTYTTANKLEPKIFVMDGSEVGEIHTFDDGSVSGNKKLCVSDGSTGSYVVKEYDEATSTWVNLRVAQIGTVGYETLEAALAAAKTGETVKMLADVTLTAKQTIDKAVVLDLNGKTISSTAYWTISLGSGANVTIRDSSTGKNGKITNGCTGNPYPRTIYLDAPGTAALTVESGIVESNPNIATLQSVAIDTDNKKTGPYVITITGGKVLVPESSTDGRAIVASKNTTLNITGGEIVGGLHGVDVYGGSTTVITGGSISARVVDTGVIEAAYGLRATGKASVTIGAADGTADVVSVAGIKMDDDGYKLNVPVVTVNSGTIAGPVYSITKGTIGFTVQATSEDVLRFADDTAAKFLPSDLELRAKDIDGKTMYYVAAKPVAAIGTTGYETLEAALAAAQDGETVKLLADVTESVTIDADRTLTLDLNGKTLSAGKASEALTVTGHLTIDDTSAAKSGRVVGDGRYAVYMKNRTAHVGEAAVGGSLTLNAGSLEGATHGVYILANQAAFTMNGGKVSATKEESIRVNNDYHAKTISLLGGEVGNVFLGSISSTELTTLTVGKADQTDPAAVKVGKIGLQYNRGLFRLELYNGLVGELPEIGSCTATYTALGMLVKSDANCPSGKVFEAIDYNGETWYRIAALQKIAITFDDSKTAALPFATDWLKAHVGEGEASWTTAALEEKAANELAKWQCYLFGLDPSKEDAKVVATAGQGTDEAIPLTVANADASASPLVTGGYVKVAYVLMGSNDGTAWTPVATSDKRDGLAIPLTGTTYKFYRVDVTVTSAEGN